MQNMKYSMGDEKQVTMARVGHWCAQIDVVDRSDHRTFGKMMQSGTSKCGGHF